ncbi:MAG: hypothetical protein KAU58_06210, partial [Candidatus Omnitrophica bacterium]|nr:hypothetical protein [Candidatus Omnitrophota bacterium]
CRGEQKGVNDIKILENSSLYIATKNGLYESFDYGKNWKRVFKGKTLDKRYIKSITIKSDKKCFYILTFSGLYKTMNNGLSWKKLIIDGIKEEINEEEEQSNIVSKKITIDKENNLYLSTNKGVFKSPDEGKSWNKLSEIGLSNRNINFCLVSEIDSDKIYAATEGGVFEYIKDENKWINLYSGLASTRIKSLSFNSRNEDFIFCLAENNIYRTTDENNYLEIIYSNFNSEPSIRNVQEMAVTYAEVHPDKIRKWRNGAKLRGILPKITFGIDRNTSDELHWDTGGSDTLVIGPDKEKTSWDITCTWDLGDFIYNEHQTTIDIRSKLMVQLREDILNEVTRLYFERRRLQMELADDKPITQARRIKKDLRLQELTASIDALTGGTFSDALKR